LGTGGAEENRQHSPSCYHSRTHLVLVFVMSDSGIINVLLSLQKDMIDVLNEKLYDVKREGGAQRVEKEEGVRC